MKKILFVLSLIIGIGYGEQEIEIYEVRDIDAREFIYQCSLKDSKCSKEDNEMATFLVSEIAVVDFYRLALISGKLGNAEVEKILTDLVNNECHIFLTTKSIANNILKINRMYFYATPGSLKKNIEYDKIVEMCIRVIEGMRQ